MPLMRIAFSLCLLLTTVGILVASEADELREKAEILRREAAELAELGRMEDAERVGREARELYKKAEMLHRQQRTPRSGEIAEVRRRLEQISMEQGELAGREGAEHRIHELREEAASLRNVIRELMSDNERRREDGGEDRPKVDRDRRAEQQHQEEMRRREEAAHRHEGEHRERDHHERDHQDNGHHEHEHHEHEHHDNGHHPNDEMIHRLESMRIAVDHLHQAGLHDIADHVAQRAEATEREINESRMREEQQHHEDPMHVMMRSIEELRHEIGRLHEELNRLRDR